MNRSANRLETENNVITSPKDYYLKYIDTILEPIIKAENIIISDDEVDLLTADDMHTLIKEALQEIKGYKLIKYDK